MFGIEEKSDTIISTIGTTIALLFALNLGVVIKSHFLTAPIEPTKIITYFIVFGGAIIYTVYFTVRNMTNPTKKYIEGLAIGTGGASAILIFIPTVFFTPLAEQVATGTITKTSFGLTFFLIFYIIGITLTVLFTVLVVKGSELYAETEIGKDKEDEEETEEETENEDTSEDEKTEQSTELDEKTE